MQTKTDLSYGVIALNKEDSGEWQVLLVHQISYRGDKFWIFPKGHKEEGESAEKAALRELQEETGVVDIELDKEKTFSMHYSFIHEGAKIEKTVTYFVGYTADKGTLIITQPHEVAELKWCTFAEAAALLTHSETKQILKELSDFVVSPSHLI